MKNMKERGGPAARQSTRDEILNEYSGVYGEERARTRRDYVRTQMLGEFYGGIDPRRRQEFADGGMIRESREMANMPKQAIHCEYPAGQFYENPFINDGELER